MASGGDRQGQPGKQYPNRQDMQQAPRAVPGMQYGKAQAQLEGQKVIPLPVAGGAASATPAAPIQTAPPVAPPGSMPFDRPTERPGEPVTAGLPMGPGAGPEALGPMGAQRDVLEWKKYLPQLEYMASQPGSTQTTRNLVRRIRSQMPG